MASMYDSGAYLAKNTGWHIEDSAWKARHVAKAIKRLDLPHESICDIGCGAGEVVSQLSQVFPESDFTGYEISPQAYALSLDRASGKRRFILGEAPSNSSFDVALALDVFEHIEDYFGFLRRIKSAATFKIFHIPLDMSSLGVALNNPMWARRQVGHLHYFSKETAIATLQECGYQVLDWRFTHGYLLDLKKPFAGGRTARKLAKLLLLGLPRLTLAACTPAIASRTLGGLSLLVVAK